MLKALAGPIPIRSVHSRFPPVPYLKTDPPIDFTPTFAETEDGGVEIRSGFLIVSQWRNRGGANNPLLVSEPYRATYEDAASFRSLTHDPARSAEAKVTPAQLKQLDNLLHQFAIKLAGPHISNQKTGNLYQLLVSQGDYCPWDDDWISLLFAYKEASLGLFREQAKADFMDSVRIFSQHYHAGTVEFVESAKKIFTPVQLKEILK